MTFEPTAYIATFAIMRDEHTFEQTVRFVTSGDPALFMRAILADWYDNRDAQQHLPGQITFERADIAVDDTATIRPISLDTYDELDGIVHNSGDERVAWGGAVRRPSLSLVQTDDIRDTLCTLRTCCEEALSGAWDRSDDGFSAMIVDIDHALDVIGQLEGGAR